MDAYSLLLPEIFNIIYYANNTIYDAAILKREREKSKRCQQKV